MIRRSSLRRAAKVAGAMCVAGFGALVGFSTFTTTPPQLRGLFDYLSATWGDGVLLPVSVGTLAYAYDSLPKQPNDRLVLLMGGLAGGVAGALTQVQWLSDDDPELNWTLPTAHQFNAAGIYHAVFLTAASATFAAFWGGVLNRWARSGARSGRRDVGGAIAIAVASGLGFVVLLVLDNRGADTQAAHATLATVFGALGIGSTGIALSSWVRRRSAGRQ